MYFVILMFVKSFCQLRRLACSAGAPPAETFLRVLRVHCPYERVLMLRANRAHRLTVAASVEVPVHVVRTEVEAPRAARALVERRRPIAAGVADIAEIRIEVSARNGKKNRVAIGLACYLVTVYAILRGPRPNAVGI